MDRRGKPGADGLIALFEGEIVGLIKFADPRGVARAAEILEQQRVVKVVTVLGAEAERAADVAADPAGADAMAGRLAFGDVERVAERADQLGETDGMVGVGQTDQFEFHEGAPAL